MASKAPRSPSSSPSSSSSSSTSAVREENEALSARNGGPVSAGSSARPSAPPGVNDEEEGVYAAVDLGSNSFHLMVARYAGGRIHLIDKVKERVALAEGLGADLLIDEAARERGLAALALFAERLRAVPEAHVRCVGTSTLRRAKNADEFNAAAEKVLGFPVEVISGVEEARLVFVGAASVRAPRGRRLVIDIGGGSTEVVIGEGREVDHAESLHMGCVNFTEGFFPAGKISEDRFRSAVFAARLELEPLSRTLAEDRWHEVVGTSGTIEALAEMARESGWSGTDLTKEGLNNIRKKLLSANDVDSIDLPGLTDKRRPVLPGGVAILTAFFDVLGLESISPCEGALRDGVVEELIGREHVEGVRRATLDRLIDRYHLDTQHADAVGTTAVALLDQVADDWDLPRDACAEILAGAAALHEVGLSIRYGGYHKHGCYILDNSDMPGFSQDEQGLLARLVLCHRRKLRHESFADLHEPWASRGVLLAILLRLAVRLHRGRADTPPDVQLAVKGQKIKLRLPANFLDEHPLTRVDLEAERKRLQRAEYELKVK